MFHTNNYGLVQKNDISNKKSILFLGDSFAQGVGAKPVFQDVVDNAAAMALALGG